MVTRVLMDACLLVKGSVTNIFLDLANQGLIELHWTTEIEDEVAENWTRIQLAKDYHLRVKDNKEREHTDQERIDKSNAARDRLAKIEGLIPCWRVPGWNYSRCRGTALHEILTAETNLSSATKAVGNAKLKVDAKDYHVALAALKLKRAFAEDTVWLATENGDDLPPEVLALLDVYVLHQSLVLELLYEIDKNKVISALEKTVAQAIKPQLSKKDMVDILNNKDHIHSAILANNLSVHWGISLIEG